MNNELENDGVVNKTDIRCESFHCLQVLVTHGKYHLLVELQGASHDVQREDTLYKAKIRCCVFSCCVKVTGSLSKNQRFLSWATGATKQQPQRTKAGKPSA